MEMCDTWSVTNSRIPLRVTSDDLAQHLQHKLETYDNTTHAPPAGMLKPRREAGEGRRLILLLYIVNQGESPYKWLRPLHPGYSILGRINKQMYIEKGKGGKDMKEV